MNLGKNIDGLINGGGAFLSPQEIVSKCKECSGGSGEGAHLFVTVTRSGDTMTLDKSYSEILAAVKNGVVPFFIETNGEAATFYFLNQLTIVAGSPAPYYVNLNQFGATANKTLVYPFFSETDSGTLTYIGGIV